MKKKIISTLTIIAFLVFPLMITAQTDGPGNPGGGPGTGDIPVGGGAPIGSGLGILVALGVAYGGKKLYTLYSENQESLEE